MFQVIFILEYSKQPLDVVFTEYVTDLVLVAGNCESDEAGESMKTENWVLLNS